MAHRILILGGTTEARELAQRLVSRADYEVALSLAGRTATPLTPQAVAIRVGGFGGADGLARHLREHRVDVLVDATHPYAATISANALAAARESRTARIALHRPPWSPVPGDRWTEVDGVEQAVDALGLRPRRVFLALGRKEAHVFTRAPQHFYLLRSVDPIALTLPRVQYVLDRGPFEEADERALMEKHGIDRMVSRNSGGAAAEAKLVAARALGVPVLLLRRPEAPAPPRVTSVEEALGWLDHRTRSPAERGV